MTQPTTVPVVDTSTPSPIPTATQTASSTFTPEPTATFTETPLPQIDLSKYYIRNADGSYMLTTWNSPKVDVNLPYDKHLQVEELEKLLGAPSYTNLFVERLHASLMRASVNGIPVVQPYDPKTVCNVQWEPEIVRRGGAVVQEVRWNIKHNITCATGTFPMRPVSLFYDNRPRITGANGETLRTPIINVTVSIWNPLTKQTELRTCAVSEIWDDLTSVISGLNNEGVYLEPNYNILPEGSESLNYIISFLTKLSEKSGHVIYDPALQAEIFTQGNGIYNARFNNTVMICTHGVIPVMDAAPSP